MGNGRVGTAGTLSSAAAFLAVILLSGAALAASIEDEARSLRARCLANFGKIRTVSFSTSVAVPADSSGARAAGAPGSPSGDEVAWDRGKGKLKSRRVAAPHRALVVDVPAKVIRHYDGTASVYEEPLTTSGTQTLQFASPSPRWLWNPESLIPEKPFQVRAEGGSLVFVSSGKHPRREVRLERATGRPLGFTDTDATGKVIRVVEVSEWAVRDGIDLPGEVREEIRAKRNAFVRTTAFEYGGVNGALGEEAFVLP